MLNKESKWVRNCLIIGCAGAVVLSVAGKPEAATSFIAASFIFMVIQKVI